MTFWLIAVLVVAAVLAFGVLNNRRLMRPYFKRACSGAAWKRQFPHASATEIRAFLDVFLEAFGFTEKRRLCFRPEDKPMDIYRRFYPPGSLSDSMELETLAIGIEDTYGISIESCWREDITLGELFALTQTPKA